ncbi:mCG1051104 [Mus musculus]|nr:mCG1051104 [Mus musculus]
MLQEAELLLGRSRLRMQARQSCRKEGVGHTQIVPPRDGSRVWNVASTSQGVLLAQLELRRVICCSIPGKTSTEGPGLPFLSVSWTAAEGRKMLSSIQLQGLMGSEAQGFDD